MKMIDRAILIFIGLGIWAFVLIQAIGPGHLIASGEGEHMHGTWEIHSFKKQVEKVAKRTISSSCFVEDEHIFC